MDLGRYSLEHGTPLVLRPTLLFIRQAPVSTCRRLSQYHGLPVSTYVRRLQITDYFSAEPTRQLGASVWPPSRFSNLAAKAENQG
jgi:hypothetical protein